MRVDRRCCVCILTCVLLCGVQVGVTQADEFQPLFNGRDLTGWVLVNTPAETWTVEDGMLVCSGRPIGEIRTERMYQNFILEVEWRHMVPGGNAGIFVWADDITAKGVPFHRSVEVQVLDHGYGQSRSHTTHGDIFPIHGAKMTPINGRGGDRAFPTEERAKPSPEWNHYRIECNDGAISLAVNGKVVTQGTDCSPRKGYICLESEGGVVHYRNLRIRELPETPVDPQHIATAQRGFVSLYSGLDLRGWTTSATGATHWSANDWVLAYDGKAATPDDAMLTSAALLNEAEFVLDIRPADGVESCAVSGVTIADGLTPGKWNRVTGVVTRGILSLSIDGRAVDGEWPIGQSETLTLQPAGRTEFANVYVRPVAP